MREHYTWGFKSTRIFHVYARWTEHGYSFQYSSKFIFPPYTLFAHTFFFAIKIKEVTEAPSFYTPRCRHSGHTMATKVLRGLQTALLISK